jgi:hypothetical protein
MTLAAKTLDDYIKSDEDDVQDSDEFKAFAELDEGPRPKNTTPAYGEAGSLAWMIAPCTNVYTKDDAYVWLRLVVDGLDLDVEDYADGSIGDEPEWWEMVTESGWDSILGSSWEHSGPFEFPTRWLSWALEHGICPGQPFLAWVGTPRTYKSSYEYDEWDIEFEGEVLFALPKKPEHVRKSWERALKRLAECRTAVLLSKQAQKHLTANDRATMVLEHDSYWHDSYCDQSPPNAVIVRVRNKGGVLAEGRDDKGDSKVAMDRLIERLAVTHPHLEPDFIRGLKVRQR